MPKIFDHQEQIRVAREKLDVHFRRKAIEMDRRILDAETFAAHYPGVPYQTPRGPRAPRERSPLSVLTEVAVGFGREVSDEALEAWQAVLDVAPQGSAIEGRAEAAVARLTNGLAREEDRILSRHERDRDRAVRSVARKEKQRIRNRAKHLRRLAREGRTPGPPGRPVPPPFLITDVTVVCEGKIGAQRKWLVEDGGLIFDLVADTAARAFEIYRVADDRSLFRSTASPRFVAGVLESHLRGSTRTDWIAEPPREVVPCHGYYYVGLRPFRCPFSAGKYLKRVSARAVARS